MKRFVFLLLFLATPAAADSGMLMSGVANRQMPLDVLTASTACYSWRRLRTAYTTNKAVNVVRASDSTTTDIGFRADGSPDTTTLATFLNATTGKVVTRYDQCGARDATQASDSARPTVVLSAIGAFPAMALTLNTQTIVTANFTPTSGVASIGGIAARTAGNGTCHVLRENGANNRLIFTNGAGSMTLTGGTSGSIAGGTAGTTPLTVVGVLNGASSILAVNSGGGTTGTATGNTTAGAIGQVGQPSTTCQNFEEILWDNYALTTSESLFYRNGARSFGGF